MRGLTLGENRRIFLDKLDSEIKANKEEFGRLSEENTPDDYFDALDKDFVRVGKSFSQEWPTKPKSTESG